MKSKGNGSVIGSSIKSSLTRYFESPWFMWLSFMFVMCLEVYLVLVFIMTGSDMMMVGENTKNFSSDTSLVKVSYINEDEVVFLEDGTSWFDYSLTRVTWGNDYWFSTELSVLGVPMSFRECCIDYILLVGLLVGSVIFCTLLVKVLRGYWVNAMDYLCEGIILVSMMLGTFFEWWVSESLFGNNGRVFFIFGVGGALLTVVCYGVCSGVLFKLSKKDGSLEN